MRNSNIQVSLCFFLHSCVLWFLMSNEYFKDSEYFKYNKLIFQKTIIFQILLQDSCSSKKNINHAGISIIKFIFMKTREAAKYLLTSYRHLINSKCLSLCKMEMNLRIVINNEIIVGCVKLLDFSNPVKNPNNIFVLFDQIQCLALYWILWFKWFVPVPLIIFFLSNMTLTINA